MNFGISINYMNRISWPQMNKYDQSGNCKKCICSV